MIFFYEIANHYEHHDPLIHGLVTTCTEACTQYAILTHCDLVMPYGDIDLNHSGPR